MLDHCNECIEAYKSHSVLYWLSSADVGVAAAAQCSLRCWAPGRGAEERQVNRLYACLSAQQRYLNTSISDEGILDFFCTELGQASSPLCRPNTDRKSASRADFRRPGASGPLKLIQVPRWFTRPSSGSSPRSSLPPPCGVGAGSGAATRTRTAAVRANSSRARRRRPYTTPARPAARTTTALQAVAPPAKHTGRAWRGGALRGILARRIVVLALRRC